MKVSLSITTSAFAAHMARQYWGDDFELNKRTHRFLYKHINYVEINNYESIPTDEKGFFNLSCSKSQANKAKSNLHKIGVELHYYFIDQMNLELWARYYTGMKVIDTITVFMDRWDLDYEVLKLDTIKKSFLRFRDKMQEKMNLQLRNVKINEKLVINDISSAIAHFYFVLENSYPIALHEVDKTILTLSIQEAFGIEIKEIRQRNPKRHILFAKKIYCFVLHEELGYSYSRISTLTRICRRQVIYNVQEVRSIKKLNLQNREHGAINIAI